MKKTKVVCTMGPNTNDRELLKKLIENGMDVARFNFSHGDHEEQKSRMDLLKELRQELNTNTAILLDTKGPEIRIGDVEGGKLELKPDQEFTLTTEEMLGTEKKVTITYKELYKDVEPGDSILIDDGLIGMEVVRIDESDIVCRVKNGGFISNHKGVNVPGVELNMPFVSPKDLADIVFAVEQDYDFIAASFTRTAEDIMEIRKILQEHGGEKIHIIAKLENKQGVKNCEDILRVADGIMIARGDMMSVEDVLEILAVDLIGAILDDEQIVISTNQGEPLSGKNSQAEEEYRNICRRLMGEEVPYVTVRRKNGVFHRLGSIFRK